MRILRLLAIVPVLGAFTVVGSVTRVGPAAIGCVSAAGTHHATLVVEHADGEAPHAICVTFTEDQITGDQLLQRSGVHYATADYGSTGKAVCQIDNEPSSYPPGCWTASSPYWALYVSRGGGAWTSSSRGISTQTFADGDAEGFRYEGQSDQSTPPSPAGVCPPPAPPATPTPAPASQAPSRPGPASTPAGSSDSPGRATSASGTTATVSPTSAATTTTTGATSSGPGPSPTMTASSPSASASAGLALTPLTHTTSPPSFPLGAVAAVSLAVAMLGLLVVQARRTRRHPAP